MLQPMLQPKISRQPYATALADFVQSAMGNNGRRIPPYPIIQDHLILPNGFRKLGGATSKFQNSIADLSSIRNNELVIQPSPRRATTRQQIRSTPASQVEMKRAGMTKNIHSELIHRKSHDDGKFRTDTIFTHNSNLNDGTELPFNGDLITENDVPQLLKENDTIGLRGGLEGRIESILNRELLKYGPGASYPEVSKRLSRQAQDIPENENEESELRVLKRRLEQILIDQLRNYYGMQI